jgi:adenylate cyclase
MSLIGMQKHGSTVLVVDDDAVTRIMLRRSLELYGYQVIEADDGEQCLAIVDHQRPDLIVLDGVMPRMDGFTVVSRMRAEDSTRTIPILMLTSLQDVSYKVRGFELGADDFLNKPVDRVELIARVRSLLRLKQYHDELEQKNILLRQALSRYVVEEVANEILAQKQPNLYVNGQASRVTVLYAGVRGFCNLLGTHDAKVVIKMLNSIYEKLVPIIFDHRGTFDKYIGDAVTAFFGAPVPYADDPLRAVNAAVDMQAAFNRLKKEQSAFAMLGLSIGIFTGEAVVGYIGAEQAMDYGVLGRPASAAKLLEEQADSGQILIDPATWIAVGEHVDSRPLDPVLLTGEASPIEPFEVLGSHVAMNHTSLGG